MKKLPAKRKGPIVKAIPARPVEAAFAEVDGLIRKARQRVFQR